MSTEATAQDLSFPIGKLDRSRIGPQFRSGHIADIRELPERLKAAVAGLSEEQIDTEYRPGGWTVRQTVHHIADSHLNSLVRFKLALTEDVPTIKPYEEALWAELGDSKLPIEVSLKLIEGLHERFTALLESMSNADFAKKLNHPDSGEWTLDSMLALYAWHSKHHTAHITSLRERNSW